MKKILGKQVDEDKVKVFCIDGLNTFADFCEKYNLCYFLAFGTLLGAVRHQGFIPWDDDIDLLMPRADYEKLRLLSQEIETEDWELLSYTTEQRFLFSYLKYCNKQTWVLPSRFNSGLVYGLSIDIFPLDFFEGNSVEDVKERVNRLRNGLVMHEKLSCKANVVNPGVLNSIKRCIKKCFYMICFWKIKSLRKHYENLDALLVRESAKDGKYAACVINRYKNIWEKKDFFAADNQKRMLSFQGRSFSVPFDYDSVLKASYGNYMEPPPENKRVSGHKYKAYYRY